MPAVKHSSITLVSMFRTLAWIAVSAVILFVIIPALSYGVWKIWPHQSKNVVIINKTVPFDNFYEHQSFFWILNHLKFRHSNGDYDLSENYFGFKPQKTGDAQQADFSKLNTVQKDSIISSMDLLYIIDTYGIYERDYDPGSKTNKKLYGGLTQVDLDMLEASIKAEKSVVVEFNTIASPTSNRIRTDFERLLGIQWSGWVARYFDELDIVLNTDIPEWIMEAYVKQHGHWDFKGKGVIFIKNDGKIEVFDYPKMMHNAVPFIHSTSKSRSQYSLPERVAYPHWIEVNRVSRDFEVISYYDLEPSEEGRRKLAQMGLPRYFPATVKRKNGSGDVYYFSGDFAGHSVIKPGRQFFGVPWLWRFFYSPEDYSRRDSFFWQYYFPLMKNIMAE